MAERLVESVLPPMILVPRTGFGGMVAHEQKRGKLGRKSLFYCPYYMDTVMLWTLPIIGIKRAEDFPTYNDG